MAFELEEVFAGLTYKNERLEKMGELDRLACDLTLQVEAANSFLAHFSPTLRAGLYQKPDDGQGVLVEDVDHLTKLRFPQLGVLHWTEGDLVGATLRFHIGIKPASHLVFDQVKVNKYRIECKEGGTVVLTFRAQVYPTDSQSGKLSKLLVDKVCTISVTAPGEDVGLEAGSGGGRRDDDDDNK